MNYNADFQGFFLLLIITAAAIFALLCALLHPAIDYLPFFFRHVCFIV
jgi:hypothetical protein